MITSSANKTVKLIKSLSTKKGRRNTGLFAVEGIRFVSEIPAHVEIVFYAISENFYVKDAYFRRGVERIYLAENIYECISDTVAPQGIMAVCKKTTVESDAFFSRTSNGLLIILEGLRDPGNLGTIIRSADAFGAAGVILTENTVDAYSPKVLRSTMGSIFRVPLILMDLKSALNELRLRRTTIIGTLTDADICCCDVEFSMNTAVIIGNESFGISIGAKEACDKFVKIPMEGSAESLNAAMAASVIMYEALRQKKT